MVLCRDDNPSPSHSTVQDSVPGIPGQTRATLIYLHSIQFFQVTYVTKAFEGNLPQFKWTKGQHSKSTFISSPWVIYRTGLLMESLQWYLREYSYQFLTPPIVVLLIYLAHVHFAGRKIFIQSREELMGTSTILRGQFEMTLKCVIIWIMWRNSLQRESP